MYIKDVQKYNTFVYKCEEDKSIKSTLLNDMHFSVRTLSSIKRKESKLTVNNRKPPKNFHIKKGDIIKVVFEDEKSDYITQYKDIDILYEDDDILVIDKPPFMVSHPTKNYFQDTVLNYVQGIFEEKKIKSKIRFISRLDRDTSGIMTIAKNSFAHYAISQGFLADKLKKYYTAITSKKMKETQGTINKKIKLYEDGIKRIVSSDGQDAITHYKVLKSCKNYSLVELLLETGRTHQIRVHLKSLDCPILGDKLYCEKSNIINRQALHCSRLEIISPRSMKKITINSNLPKDIKKIIENNNFKDI